MILLFADLALGACPDGAVALDDAFAALSTLDLPRVEARLDEARSSFACGAPVTSDVLGRYWLAEGVAASLAGDAERAGSVFAAARRADPGLRADTWGDEVRAAWSSAGAPAGTGRLLTLAPLSGRDALWVDGVASPVPAEVGAGWHLVQIGRFGTAWWAERVYLAPGDELTLDVATRPAAELPRRWDGGVMVGLHADVSFGERLRAEVDGQSYVQDGGQLGVPLELGYEWRTSQVWLRPAAVIAPLLNSQYLYAGEEEPVRFPLAFGGGVEGGLRLGERGRLGLLGQLAFPGQVRARAVGAVALRESLSVEGRLGVNLPAGQRPEPAMSLGGVFSF